MKKGLILFHSVLWVHFSRETEKFSFRKSLKYRNIFDEKGYGVRFEYIPWKKSLILFYFNCLGFIQLQNQEISILKSLNTLIFFDKRDMVSDLNMSHGKMSDLVSFPFFGFTLVIKLRNLDFKGH